jgi:superfamily II DNA helicase RecQ
MELTNELINRNIFTLFAAPVAKGKTFQVLKLYRENSIKMIFVSPLRALAQEVYLKLKSSEKNVFFPTGEGEKCSKKEIYSKFLKAKRGVLILTAELLEDEFLDELSNNQDKILFVLDEFHLFYTWGRDFRPILLDKFYGILNTHHAVLALSATINNQVMNELLFDLKFYCAKWIYLNDGNLSLYRKPSHIYCFKGHAKIVLERAFLTELEKKKKDEVFILFCSFRGEVDFFYGFLKNKNYRVLPCVGGEVKKFQEMLKDSDGQIDCIVSTVALSHGVNLPEIKKVFINYEVKNYDFWLQMIGRGGRNGAAYEVYTFDDYWHSKKERLLNYIQIAWRDWW